MILIFVLKDVNLFCTYQFYKLRVVREIGVFDYSRKTKETYFSGTHQYTTKLYFVYLYPQRKQETS